MEKRSSSAILKKRESRVVEEYREHNNYDGIV